MKNSICLFLVSVLFIGCAGRLKVEIQIADRNEILAAESKLPKIDYCNPLPAINAINVFVNNWKPEEKVTPILVFLDEKFPETKTLPEVKNKYIEVLNKKIDEIKDLNEKANYAFRVENDCKKATSYTLEVHKKIDEINDAFKNLYKDKGEPISITRLAVENNDIKKLDNSISQVKNVIATTAGTDRQRFPILGDELASFIAMKENDKIWKSVFNKTIASSFLGNTDIAMILRSNPPEREMKSGDYNNNFTIKGVRMDASDVSNAIINTLTQTVNFIANTQGIPSNIGTTPASVNNPLPNENPLISSMQGDKDKLEIKRKKLLEYKQLLLKKIELESIKSTDTEDQAKAKAKSIIKYWEGLKTELAKP